MSHMDFSDGGEMCLDVPTDLKPGGGPPPPRPPISTPLRET